MYYYGYNAGAQNPCGCGGFSGYNYGGGFSGGFGSYGAALWIVLFILLVIIIGAGWSFGQNRDHNNNHCC